MLDFNSAPTQRDGEFDLIPDGTIVPVQMTVRPGNAGDGGWLKRSNSGECLMIDAEFVVTEGKFSKRKFWSFMTVDGVTDGQKKAVEISVARLRAILESARGIRPDDESVSAMERRRADSYGDFDGVRFWGVVGIEKGQNGYKDKNTLKTVITPERAEWRQLDQIKSAAAPATVHPGAMQAAKAAGAAKPSWA